MLVPSTIVAMRAYAAVMRVADGWRRDGRVRVRHLLQGVVELCV